VYLRVLQRDGPSSTSEVQREALRETASRVGLRLSSVSTLLRRLEVEGAVSSTKPDPRRATVVWTLTDNGKWAIAEARRFACAALDLEPVEAACAAARTAARAAER
jgi:DNA-binding MarR family transcriptional regulator